VSKALKDPKVMSLAAAKSARARLARSGARFVLTNGVFDLLHPGHTSYLVAARKLAGPRGKLFVALNSDRSVRALKGKFRPILAEADRAYNLAQLRSVDGVVIFRRKRLDREIAALRALEKAGARIRFIPFLAGFSTTRLIEKIRAAGDL